MDGYLDSILLRLVQWYGFESEDSTIKGRYIRELLNYECGKSNGNRKYTVVGFMDEKGLKGRYGIDRLV
ncbi:hypothetical protein QGM71_12390 [Virgibacillus sp. C22-A2]|uniref:Uncharacterized protein n=1 Tax=Virgibacillus tibetensis TaxID=3042313 RepID=A0ABU6KGN2_9BACI|nr:hypothetical protein [Virgibacillus sp. C22-A2]